MGLTLITILGILMALIFILSVLIYLNMRSTKESEVNVLLRIMTNYV